MDHVRGRLREDLELAAEVTHGALGIVRLVVLVDPRPLAVEARLRTEEGLRAEAVDRRTHEVEEHLVHHDRRHCELGRDVLGVVLRDLRRGAVHRLAVAAGDTRRYVLGDEYRRAVQIRAHVAVVVRVVRCDILGDLEPELVLVEHHREAAMGFDAQIQTLDQLLGPALAPVEQLVVVPADVPLEVAPGDRKTEQAHAAITSDSRRRAADVETLVQGVQHVKVEGFDLNVGGEHHERDRPGAVAEVERLERVVVELRRVGVADEARSHNERPVRVQRRLEQIVAVPHFLQGNAVIRTDLENPGQLLDGPIHILELLETDRIGAPPAFESRPVQPLPRVVGYRVGACSAGVVGRGDFRVDRRPVLQTGIVLQPAAEDPRLVLVSLEVRERAARDHVVPEPRVGDQGLLDERVEVLGLFHHYLVEPGDGLGDGRGIRTRAGRTGRGSGQRVGADVDIESGGADHFTDLLFRGFGSLRQPRG